MGQALYRKYRSKKLSEIVGQEHITQTLQNALKTGKISHAYLFTGPRGVGKTSIARILAHEINELEYTDESMHLDIIEIDAASNRRIDEIRDLREKVHIAPTSAKYKVYIIDEVHMLTREAFNALLKTLEEPPAHVIFILATTELHKLPETIISRTQRFTFKAIEHQEAVKHLRAIAKAEGMEIDDDALDLLAVHGGGSFRDSISLLDQVGNSKKTITRADAENLVGVATHSHIENLLKATLDDGTPATILQQLDALIEDGTGPTQVAKQLAALLRQNITAGSARKEHVSLLEDLLQVNTGNQSGALLEVALLKAYFSRSNQAPAVPETIAKPKPALTAAPPVVTETIQQPEPETQPESEKPISTPSTPTHSLASPDWWDEVLKRIKTINNTLYGILRMAQPHLDGDTLRLSFGFGFHKKKVDDTPTQAKIQEAIKAVTGKDLAIEAKHDKNIGKAPKGTAAIEATETGPAPEPGHNDELASITNVFGGVEVLES